MSSDTTTFGPLWREVYSARRLLGLAAIISNIEDRWTYRRVAAGIWQSSEHPYPADYAGDSARVQYLEQVEDWEEGELDEIRSIVNRILARRANQGRRQGVPEDRIRSMDLPKRNRVAYEILQDILGLG